LAVTGLGLLTLLAAGTLSARAACNLPGGAVLELSGPGLAYKNSAYVYIGSA
jgi:hypothetical protein